MIRKFSEKLLTALRVDIARVRSEEQDAFKVLSAVLKFVRQALKKLKDFYKGHVFADDGERIWFFKVLKPQVECLRIYELELYNILTSLPAGCGTAARCLSR